MIISHDFAHKFNYNPIIRYARLLILKYDLKICSLTDMFSKMQRAKKREVICIMFVWCILLFISNSMSNQWTFILYLSWHIYHTQSQQNNETRLHEIICRSSFCYFLKGQRWLQTANLNLINFYQSFLKILFAIRIEIFHQSLYLEIYFAPTPN